MSKPQDLTRSTSDSGAEAEHPRVVVAEDEALIRLDLVELLEEHGYEIVGQALSLIHISEPRDVEESRMPSSA